MKPMHPQIQAAIDKYREIQAFSKPASERMPRIIDSEFYDMNQNEADELEKLDGLAEILKPQAY